MQHFLEEYGSITGLILLTVIVIVLLSSPESIFSNVNVVDINPYYRTPNEILVKSSLLESIIRNETLLKEFPKNIGNWEGVQFHTEEKRAREVFKTNTVLVRKYYNGERSINFVLVKGENRTDILHPVWCFGIWWNITEQGIESIQLEGWNNVTLNVNKLYAKRGNATQVVLYWFMWSDARRSIRNCIMIMIATPVYRNESENVSLNILKDFSSKLIPILYEEYPSKSDIIGKQLIDKFGIFGFILEILLIGLPLVLIFYNKIRRTMFIQSYTLHFCDRKKQEE